MSDVEPKVIWEGEVDAYPFEGAMVRVVAWHEDDGDERHFNRLVCEEKDLDALGDPAWTLVTDVYRSTNDDGTREFTEADLEHTVFNAALLLIANNARGES